MRRFVNSLVPPNVTYSASVITMGDSSDEIVGQRGMKVEQSHFNEQTGVERNPHGVRSGFLCPHLCIVCS